jgi:NAD(P)-dependent dehydrogenase (short-subunit alcohol dehydrogenase family)
MAETNQQRTHSVGIYHGLPEFDSCGNTAIVTGANGLSGQAMLKILLAHSDRWTSIYALSQGPPLESGYTGKQVHHTSVNFLADAREVAKVLKDNDVKSGYCFYFSYKESADPAVMYAENGNASRFYSKYSSAY